MDMRAEVWSPLQNSAVWLGAWLWGLCPTDDLLEALEQLIGTPRPHPHPRGDFEFDTFADLLRLIRDNTAGLDAAADNAFPGSPALRLILSGPGQPPALPAGTLAAQAASDNPYGALLIATHDPEFHMILLAYPGPDGLSWWELIGLEGRLPADAALSPGEADALLAQATAESATLIESLDYVRKEVRAPRLMVGTLADFYDTPGLPSATPARSAKLFARADRVAAIVETVTDRLGDHSLDPQLLRLWHAIRTARMAGVAYALRDFAR